MTFDRNRFDYRTDRNDLLIGALNNAELARDAAEEAGAEYSDGGAFHLAAGKASAYSQASLAYSALLAATVPADFGDES
jgi:hypothetical protein